MTSISDLRRSTIPDRDGSWPRGVRHVDGELLAPLNPPYNPSKDPKGDNGFSLGLTASLLE